MNDEVYLSIKDNENLIYKIASKYSNYYNIDDLYQAGCVGIIKAYKNYKPNNKTKFSTYAYKYILGEMIDFIRKDKKIIISDEVYELYRKYIKIKELLSSKYEKEISFSEICNYMNIDERYMLNIIESINQSLDSNDYENIIYKDDRSIIDEEIMLSSEIDELNEFDKSLINYRYYLGYTQSETADILGISQVSVSRNEKTILQRIKNNIIK